MTRIFVRHDTPLPLEVPGIVPERLEGLTASEIARLPVVYGSAQVQLGEVSRVILDSSDRSLCIAGDTGRVKRIGEGMTRGAIVVEGDTGMHAGAQMAGGSLTILGNAGHWLGAEMRGGSIEVGGDAGHSAGAGYVGSRRGMTGGSITVKGRAGDELGTRMRRGSVVVGGTVGEYAGGAMIAGTIVGLSGFGRRMGTGMKRGTLIACGQTAPLSAGLRYCCEYAPAYLDLIRTRLWPSLPRGGSVPCYRGDILTGGRGELLLLPPIDGVTS